MWKFKVFTEESQPILERIKQIEETKRTEIIQKRAEIELKLAEIESQSKLKLAEIELKQAQFKLKLGIFNKLFIRTIFYFLDCLTCSG